MALLTNRKTQPRYDVIVVGSGAAGGQTAYTLAMEGVKVLMLEAGRDYDPVRETPMFQTGIDAPLRGVKTPDKPFGFHDATVDGGWEVPGEPYTNASDDPKRRFMWWRARMLGGRTNHWGRIALRNGAYDFKPRSRDGLGFDWPISYADVAPYYDKVEMLIGVYGTNEGLENTPSSPDGVLLPAPSSARANSTPSFTGKKSGCPSSPSTARCSASASTVRASPRNSILTTRRRNASSRSRWPRAPPVSGPRPAAAVARSAPTISPPPSICRRRWPREISTFLPMQWATACWWTTRGKRRAFPTSTARRARK